MWGWGEKERTKPTRSVCPPVSPKGNQSIISTPSQVARASASTAKIRCCVISPKGKWEKISLGHGVTMEGKCDPNPLAQHSCEPTVPLHACQTRIYLNTTARSPACTATAPHPSPTCQSGSHHCITQQWGQQGQESPRTPVMHWLHSTSSVCTPVFQLGK